MDVEGTTTLLVQNVGGGKTFPISWRKAKRLAGPELRITDAKKQAALHDLQKFLVEEFLGWRMKRGEAQLKVRWRGYNETTWEPLAPARGRTLPRAKIRLQDGRQTPNAHSQAGCGACGRQ